MSTATKPRSMRPVASTHRAYISLGSNIGDRLNYLQQALSLLKQLANSLVTKVSLIYDTAPIGNTEQDTFLNAVICLETNLSAIKLLQHMQTIENQLGRTRETHWGPRTIDLDLLLYDHETWASNTLSLPHPQMHQRRFVLQPLINIAPSLSLHGQTLADLLTLCKDQTLNLSPHRFL